MSNDTEIGIDVNCNRWEPIFLVSSGRYQPRRILGILSLGEAIIIDAFKTLKRFKCFETKWQFHLTLCRSIEERNFIFINYYSRERIIHIFHHIYLFLISLKYNIFWV